ncbi:PREDICTED: 1,5-anhydro-D-fructose reductase-like [Nicrophorus vespilloides]|uniref:1,5-anhydro-D-fructose reductase-like n=1 Tax=Nicrophorus vespilloides TaxID=110193 RepID=A0ABM1M265_NICVS|nr:PREDICTED: 1,5-anhydro-D-fructose reductase-like [Nicrophorus vespilloides]XP_017768667.1 PREDICTED: 1,5-anhydro-D-fructose reductase-like [Nicrophorus vespilloides]
MGIPTVTLSNGQKIPAVGLGTWQAAPGEVEDAVKNAIDMGYRHFDCAFLYGNEHEIGNAIREKIKDGSVKREDLYIVTKLWNTFHETEQVVPACKKSLENFGLDYVDLYLVHWPVAQKMKGESSKDLPFKDAEGYDYDYVDTWKGMEECLSLGLTKSIGVSNFNSEQIERLLENCKVKPVMNQIEVHPNLNQKKLIKFCKERDIAITAYSPFGSPSRPWAKPGDPVLSLTDPHIVAIGNNHGKTSAQVILRYIVQLGCIPIPKSTSLKRITENSEIFDFELTESEVEVLDGMNCEGRAVPAFELRDMPNYPFNIAF